MWWRFTPTMSNKHKIAVNIAIQKFGKIFNEQFTLLVQVKCPTFVDSV